MQLGLWLVVCIALAVLLRRRPAILVSLGLGIWIVVPSVASAAVTGIDSGSLSFAPSTWLILISLVVQLLYDGGGLMQEIARRPFVYVALFLVLSVAFLATKTSPGGSGVVLFTDQIAAPVALFMVAGAGLWRRPGDIAVIRNTIVWLAAAEGALTIVQFATHSIIFYRTYFAKTYWFNELVYDRWMGTTDQPLTLSLLICVAVPLVAGIRRLWLQIPLLLIMAIGVIITQSRSGVALVGLGIVYVILTTRVALTSKILALVAMSIAGFVVLSSSLTAGVAGRVAYDQGSAVARGDAFGLFFDNWLDYFFTGGGIGFSYRFADLGGLTTSLESSIMMYAIDIGVVFSLLYFGTQLVIVLRSAGKPGCPGVFLAGLMVLIIPQTYSALATGSLAGVLLWTVLAMAAALGTNSAMASATATPAARVETKANLRDPGRVIAAAGVVPAAVTPGSALASPTAAPPSTSSEQREGPRSRNPMASYRRAHRTRNL